MRVLFDQAIPLPLRPFLLGHAVRTVAQEGWDRLRNGELLTAAEGAGFNVFLTTDKNLRYQQNLTGRNLAVVVLRRQQWPELRSHTSLIAAAVNGATSGGYVEVNIP